MIPAAVRITVTAQALTEAGEAVGDAVREEFEVPVHGLTTFDPARRVVATRARDLGERAAGPVHDALTKLAGA